MVLVRRLGETAERSQRQSLAKGWFERADGYKQEAETIRRILRHSDGVIAGLAID